MKKLLLIAIVSSVATLASANVASDSHTQINKQIEEIKPPRDGVKASAVLRTKSPFLLYKTGKDGKRKTYTAKKKVKLPPLKMESSINNNVKINGKWYKEGDRVRQYTIVKVTSGEVLLKSKKKEIKLYQNQKNDKINFNVN